MSNVDDPRPKKTVRRSGPRPHQSRVSTPPGCEAERGPERRTKKATRCEQPGSGWAGGEPRSGEGASPPGAPGGLRELTEAVWAVAVAVDGLRADRRACAAPADSAPPTMANWSDLDVERARQARPTPRLRVLRPIESKTPREQAILDRLRKTTGKETEE
jgi:hypothetical protein